MIWSIIMFLVGLGLLVWGAATTKRNKDHRQIEIDVSKHAYKIGPAPLFALAGLALMVAPFVWGTLGASVALENLKTAVTAADGRATAAEERANDADARAERSDSARIAEEKARIAAEQKTKDVETAAAKATAEHERVLAEKDGLLKTERLAKQELEAALEAATGSRDKALSDQADLKKVFEETLSLLERAALTNLVLKCRSRLS